MNRILVTTALTLAATPFLSLGQDSLANPNRFSLGARLGFNFKAEFTRNTAFNPGPATGGADHNYDDGYVLLDSSGNAGGLTSNWGYDDDAQVVGNTMEFHSLQGSGKSTGEDDPQYGGEFIYQRVLGRAGNGHCDWGLEFGLGFTDLNLRSDENETGLVTTDAYQLGAVTPPPAGYRGTADGPGPLLGDTPTRTTAAADITSRQKLTGQMIAFRFGPFAEWNITSQLHLAGSVGLTLAPTTVEYEFSETATLAGGQTLSSCGRECTTELLYGGYLSATLGFDFTDCCGVYVGAQFQSLTDLEQTVGSRTARLDASATVYLTAGLSWRF